MSLEWNDIKTYVDGYVIYKNAYEELANAVTLMHNLLNSGCGWRSAKAADALHAFFAAAETIDKHVENCKKGDVENG